MSDDEDRLSQSQFRTIAHAISEINIIDILSLNLKNNGLQDDALTTVSEILPRLNVRESIWINILSNEIGNTGAESLASTLASLSLSCKSIQINLSNNQIGDEGLSAILDSLTTNNELENLSLNLSNNQIGAEGLRAIARNIQAGAVIPNNLTLILDRNRIGSTAAIELAEALESYNAPQNLRIDMIDCDINQAAMQRLAEAVANTAVLHGKNIKLCVAPTHDSYYLHKIGIHISPNIRYQILGNHWAIIYNKISGIQSEAGNNS